MVQTLAELVTTVVTTGTAGLTTSMVLAQAGDVGGRRREPARLAGDGGQRDRVPERGRVVERAGRGDGGAAVDGARESDGHVLREPRRQRRADREDGGVRLLDNGGRAGEAGDAHGIVDVQWVVRPRSGGDHGAAIVTVAAVDGIERRTCLP